MKYSLKYILLALLVVAFIAPMLAAHPHFQKTTTAKLPGEVEVSVSFFTVPSNMSHADEAANGAFLAPGLAKLTTSKALKAGSVSIPAGTYTVGAVKNGASDWTMALSPGELGFGDSPDMSKLIKLESNFESSPVNLPHLVVDITPGEGDMEGESVVFIGFGTLWLSGSISDAVAE